MAIAVLLFLTYGLLAANALRAEYKIEDLEKKIVDVQKASDELRIGLSEVSSLDYVLERSGSLSYTEVESVSYIEKVSTPPFAAR